MTNPPAEEFSAMPELQQPPTRPYTLTPREIEILAWVARGKSAWEIGAILHITKRTVDAHANSAVRKMGATNRTHAVVIALRDHIIDIDDPLLGNNK
jgi:LuxR family transcriptional regulator, quorum-sensing system regulator BjaR1